MYENFSNSHPLLSEFKNLVHMHLPISKMNRKYAFQNRYLVIHSAGIFLLKPAFKGIKISRCIAFPGLVLIELDEDILELKSDSSVVMKINSPENAKIAAMVYSIKSILYGIPDSNFLLRISKHLQRKFDSNFYNFDSNHPLADRLLGYIMYSRFPYKPEVSKIYQHFSGQNTEIVIPDFVISSSYSDYILKCLTNKADFKSITFESFDFGSHASFIGYLLTSSNKLTSLTFKDIYFTKYMNPTRSFIESDSLANLLELTFDDCDMIDCEMSSFFEHFCVIAANLKVLTFRYCSMSEDNINAIFQSILFSECFFSLETFEISECSLVNNFENYLLQYLCSKYVGEVKVLKNLIVDDNRIRRHYLSVSDILGKLTFETGLQKISFCGCDFDGHLNDFSLDNIGQIYLDRCAITRRNLLYFLESLTTNQHRSPLFLSLASLKMENLSGVYSSLSKVKIPNLEGLVWDNNLVTRKDIESFVEFLKNQPYLKVLSLNSCFKMSDTDEVIYGLFQVIKSHEFIKFSMRGDKSRFIGPRLLPLISELLNSHKLSYLDISYQSIGYDAASVILQKIQSVDVFYFTGLGITNYKDLVNICYRVLELNIKSTQWPGVDFNTVAKPTDGLKDFITVVNDLKHKFRKKFSEQSLNDAFLPKITAIHSNYKSEVKSQIKSVSLCSSPLKENIDRENQFIIYDDGYKKLMEEECRDVLGSTPLTKLVSNINSSISLQKMLNTFEKLISR